MMKPIISVALATYNGERFITEQLQSLANQSDLPYELVVTDDGSTDRTLAILNDFANTVAFPVKVHSNPERLGFSDNFIKAASLCSGDWIAFSDQDDVWMLNKLARFRQTIERHRHDDLVMVGHTSLLSDGRLRPTGQRLPDFASDRLVKRASNEGFFCIVGFSMACRADLIRRFDPGLRPRRSEADWTPPGHDQWLGMLANIVGNIAVITEPLAIWRRHGDSLTRPPSPQTILDETRVSFRANQPDAYLLRATMAQEAAASFHALAKSCTDIAITKRLSEGAHLFTRLSNNLRSRGHLYSSTQVSLRLNHYARLLATNAYFGPPVAALGWRSCAKDLLFALGML